MWQHFDGRVAIRLHLLPSLVLPAHLIFFFAGIEILLE
jgi:hypothetical protein